MSMPSRTYSTDSHSPTPEIDPIINTQESKIDSFKILLILKSLLLEDLVLNTLLESVYKAAEVSALCYGC